jgi:hypothetical protein
MQALIDIIMPVFLVAGFGYLAVWRGWFTDAGVDGLMRFTQHFAIPALLFSAISQLDLGQSFNWRLLLSFYAGAISGFTLGLLGARFIFGRSWEDAVAIGFCGLFSNTVLLGLPLTERAWGPEALSANFAIIALHSPVCYGIGITAMEIARASGKSGAVLAGTVLKAMFSNALIIGIGLGFVVNLSGLPLPGVLENGLEMLTRAALPAALFGLGGVLVRYRIAGDLRLIGFICVLALVVHPLITIALARGFDLPTQTLRSAVLTAAMAPGINAYIFASLYGRAQRVAASSVLIATMVSMLSVWVWLQVLP